MRTPLSNGLEAPFGQDIASACYRQLHQITVTDIEPCTITGLNTQFEGTMTDVSELVQEFHE